MRYELQGPKRNPYAWNRWFAWHPVMVVSYEGARQDRRTRIVWLETVIRQRDPVMQAWNYRFI